jgi:hypothetical protein
MVTDEQVEELAQVIRAADVLTRLGRHGKDDYTMVRWDSLIGREKAPYINAAIAVWQHFRSQPLTTIAALTTVLEELPDGYFNGHTSRGSP